MTSIKHWPDDQRPREKLLAQGAELLSDAELLAIFLRTGVAGCSALDLAHSLLGTFGGVRGVLEATRTKFCAQRGMGDSKYAQLQATLELSRRHMLQGLQRSDCLTSTALTRRYLRTRMRNYPREVFICLFLDSQNRVIACEELFHGTINGSVVHPREVVRRALHHNAAALIFAHNHPSGVAEPSQADINITQRLKEALAMVDIRTLDHMVVGDTEVISLAERGVV
ncbi:MAG: DNA repair protein RadC [Pseudomonadales bacterium]|jgi:DNA repair protein RadC|nr:DNA repair protein RadC [Pseudomonadales bacterium]